MKKKNIIILTILIAAIAIAVWSWMGKKEQNKIQFVTEQVTRGDFSIDVTATGSIEPVTQVEVGTQVSGIVTKLLVDYNSVVKKGDVIAELDKSNLMIELKSRENSLASAESKYKYETSNYNRSKVLYEKKLIAESDYDLAHYNYESALNNYNIAKADYEKAKTNLGYATIYSPIDGVVLSRSVEEGQTVAASFNTPTLFVIAADLTDMQVIANVDEADIGYVKVGQRVSFTVDAYPNDLFHGEVLQVRQQAVTTNNVVTYEVKISASNPDLKLKPGLTASITIHTNEQKNVLLISNKALKFRPFAYVKDTSEMKGLEDDVNKLSDSNKNSIVWFRENNQFKAIAITTSVSDGTQTIITQGLEEGQEIINQANTDNSVVVQEEVTNPFMPQRRNQKKKDK